MQIPHDSYVHGLRHKNNILYYTIPVKPETLQQDRKVTGHSTSPDPNVTWSGLPSTSHPRLMCHLSTAIPQSRLGS